MAVSMTCLVCGSRMNKCIQVWHSECLNCGYEYANFEPAINEAFAHKQIDERFREKGLQALRIENFDRLLQAIEDNGTTSGRILDVGCAHGWFLEAASKRGFNALGIEPDMSVFNESAKRGLSIRQGFFPEVLEANEQFDIIIFNDVFEHMPDIISILSGCSKHLKPKGILVLNLPSSKGLFYSVSRLLSKMGINSFFERLWQKGLPSPHLHYFNQDNLQSLLLSNGFEEISRGSLSTLRFKGLFARVSYTGSHSLPVNLAISFFAALAVPILFVMPSDIVYSIFKKSK